jgi:hypothetical protein
MVDVETALLRGAVGDYADEAAVLLIKFGHWLPQVQPSDLITLVADMGGGAADRLRRDHGPLPGNV